MQASTPYRILLVEDLPSLRISLRRTLERMGYEVTTANDGEHALEVIRSGNFDLICMDVVLPRDSGYQVCESVRQHLGVDVPVLLMNDRASPLDRAQAYEVGAEGYLCKPFTSAELREEIKRLLDGRALGRACGTSA